MLERLNTLRMGVRVDRPGHIAWDYHTVGHGKVKGIRQAKDGKVKITASTHEPETLLSRREYLWDASFLVALHGDPELVREAAAALETPVWPIYLGRKTCIPGEPVLLGAGTSPSPEEALASLPWQPRSKRIDRELLPEWNATEITLPTFVEHPVGSKPPREARLSYDVARAFGFFNYHPRWVVPGEIAVPIGEELLRPAKTKPRRRPNYGSAQWRSARKHRLDHDLHRCVFCGQPATEVHHVHYETVGAETNDDLRSLCDTCHDACTMLEYSYGMQAQRVDPLAPEVQSLLQEQVERIEQERQRGAASALMRRLRKHRSEQKEASS